MLTFTAGVASGTEPPIVGRRALLVGLGATGLTRVLKMPAAPKLIVNHAIPSIQIAQPTTLELRAMLHPLDRYSNSAGYLRWAWTVDHSQQFGVTADFQQSPSDAPFEPSSTNLWRQVEVTIEEAESNPTIGWMRSVGTWTFRMIAQQFQFGFQKTNLEVMRAVDQITDQACQMLLDSPSNSPILVIEEPQTPIHDDTQVTKKPE